MAEEHCGITPDYSAVTIIELEPEPVFKDYRAAMTLADDIATEKLGQFMLLSWYDRDRDIESPRNSSECHEDAAVPGYVDYGLNHGATLKIDLYQGRFIFFYMPL
ncbi:MAG: AF1514 family protein [Gammaproteobacteria bacterium]|nr:AF1514 family protein [Gammaproteobacteria bacterium]